jgi:hypothetical protein
VMLPIRCIHAICLVVIDDGCPVVWSDIASLQIACLIEFI